MNHPYSNYIVALEVCSHCGSEVTEVCGECYGQGKVICEPCHKRSLDPRIAKDLKTATAYGPEHVADLINQKLVRLLWELEEGVPPKKAIDRFKLSLGMDQIKGVK